MEERNVYQDISQRTDGDVYIGGVGPVRTGKSTFIKRFMDALVLPNIKDESIYRRTVDELPQSSAGKTIMTTEPKFIPEESVEINLGNNATFKVRMIDCVGYIVDSAIGYNEEDMPRMVKTPWSDKEIPFEQAAEIGTKKVKRDDKTFLSLSKICFRVLLEPGLDIIIVLGREGDKIFAKTAYLNKTNDNHKVGFNPERYYPYTIEGVKVKGYVKKVKVLVKKKESLEDLFTRIYQETHL